MAIWRIRDPFLLSFCAKLCYVLGAVIKIDGCKKADEGFSYPGFSLEKMFELEAGSSNIRMLHNNVRILHFISLHLDRLQARSATRNQGQNLDQRNSDR